MLTDEFYNIVPNALCFMIAFVTKYKKRLSKPRITHKTYKIRSRNKLYHAYRRSLYPTTLALYKSKRKATLLIN